MSDTPCATCSGEVKDITDLAGTNVAIADLVTKAAMAFEECDKFVRMGKLQDARDEDEKGKIDVALAAGVIRGQFHVHRCAQCDELSFSLDEEEM